MVQRRGRLLHAGGAPGCCYAILPSLRAHLGWLARRWAVERRREGVVGVGSDRWPLMKPRPLTRDFWGVQPAQCHVEGSTASIQACWPCHVSLQARLQAVAAGDRCPAARRRRALHGRLQRATAHPGQSCCSKHSTRTHGIVLPCWCVPWTLRGSAAVGEVDRGAWAPSTRQTVHRPLECEFGPLLWNSDSSCNFACNSALGGPEKFILTEKRALKVRWQQAENGLPFAAR